MIRDEIDREKKRQAAIEAAERAEREEIKREEDARRAAEEGPSLKEVIQEKAIEEEEPLSSKFTLSKILGGDILNTSAIRRQVPLLILITFFIIIYVSNRYSCQKDLIEIDKLNKELVNAKYKALSTSSQLTEKSRESHILEMLKQNHDSVLKISSQPPFIVYEQE